MAGIRELSDARVIVVDSREKSLELLDLGTGSAVRIGRVGAGPGEYGAPRRIYALPGDSSLVQDEFNSRFVVVFVDRQKGTLGLVPWVRPTSARGAEFHVRAVDHDGILYGEAAPIRRSKNGSPELVDSLAIERLHRNDSRRDTVTQILAEPVKRTIIQGGVVLSERRQPYGTWNQWAAAPDGRVAIAHFEPYHVEFVDKTGRHWRGPDLPFQQVRLTDSHKRQWEESRQTSAFASSADERLSVTSARQAATWPKFLPPFLYDAVRMAPDGRLWIRRTSAADTTSVYDIIDRKGGLARRIAFPARSRLVGFSDRYVYVVRSDDNDLQYLQRYRGSLFQ